MKTTQRKCKICGERYTPKYVSTEPCPKYECRIILAEKAIDKAKKMVSAIQKKADKAMKDKNTDWRAKLQIKVQEIVRLIDYGLPCLAIQKMANQYHGGHVYSRGAHSNIALNLHNIHRQSAHSNHYQSHDVKMREGIIREYGQDYMDMLTGLLSFTMPKISNEKYKELYYIACEEANVLKKDKRVRTASERISERDRINNVLGIYNNN